MKIIKLNNFRKSLSVLISLTILLSNTNSLMLENNARLKSKSLEKEQKANSSDQNFLNPQIVQNLPKAINEANRILNPSNNTGDSNNSFNSNNNADRNFRKLYNEYESVNVVRTNTIPEGAFMASSRPRTEDDRSSYARARESVIPKMISSHNVDIISGNMRSSPPAVVRSNYSYLIFPIYFKGNAQIKIG